MRVALRQLGPCLPENVILLERFPVVVGRDPECDIHVEDIWVSPYHCMIEDVGGSVMVLDLAARTGTFVNGQRIRKATLAPGDRLTIGRTNLVVGAPAPAAQQVG